MKGKRTLETNVSKLKFLRQKRLFELARPRHWRGRGIGEAEADIDEMKGKLTLETNVSKLKCLKQKRLFETIVFRANEKQTFQLGTVQSYVCSTQNNRKQTFCRIVCFRAKDKRFRNKCFRKNKQTNKQTSRKNVCLRGSKLRSSNGVCFEFPV